MRSRVVAGAVLIAVGILNFAMTRLVGSGEMVPLIIGSGLMIWFAFTRSYGLLIPASIMTGIGLGVAIEDSYVGRNEPVVIGLGLGFIAIYVIDWLMGNRRQGGWWPCIPGGILLLVGFQELFYSDIITRWWPLALVVLGILLVMQRPRTPSSKQVSQGEDYDRGE